MRPENKERRDLSEPLFLEKQIKNWTTPYSLAHKQDPSFFFILFERIFLYSFYTWSNEYWYKCSDSEEIGTI